MENVSSQIVLKRRQLDYLDQMAEKYKLPNIDKALRCLINYASASPEEERKIFEDIRCPDC